MSMATLKISCTKTLAALVWYLLCVRGHGDITGQRDITGQPGKNLLLNVKRRRRAAAQFWEHCVVEHGKPFTLTPRCVPYPGDRQHNALERQERRLLCSGHLVCHELKLAHEPCAPHPDSLEQAEIHLLGNRSDAARKEGAECAEAGAPGSAPSAPKGAQSKRLETSASARGIQ